MATSPTTRKPPAATETKKATKAAPAQAAPTKAAAAVAVATVKAKTSATKSPAKATPARAAKQASATAAKKVTPRPAAKVSPPVPASKPKAQAVTKAPAKATKRAADNGKEGGDSVVTAMIKNLIAKGRDEGFITHDQILQAIPAPEAHMGAIEELYAAALEAGVEVLDAQNQPTLLDEADEDEDEEEEAEPETGAKPTTAKSKQGEEDLEALAADLIGI
ncbi:MAG: hypothetical protein H0W10_07210, partial [Chloroflexi bacterium]|nr:hypothetical protein [Chloroflexota bacterium]